MSWNWLSKENIGLARIDLITSLITIVPFFQELISFSISFTYAGLVTNWSIHVSSVGKDSKFLTDEFVLKHFTKKYSQILLISYQTIPNDEANSRIRKAHKNYNRRRRSSPKEKKVFIEISSRTGKSLPFICFLRNCKNRTLLNQNAINILWIMEGGNHRKNITTHLCC